MAKFVVDQQPGTRVDSGVWTDSFATGGDAFKGILYWGACESMGLVRDGFVNGMGLGGTALKDGAVYLDANGGAGGFLHDGILRTNTTGFHVRHITGANAASHTTWAVGGLSYAFPGNQSYTWNLSYTAAYNQVRRNSNRANFPSSIQYMTTVMAGSVDVAAYVQAQNNSNVGSTTTQYARFRPDFLIQLGNGGTIFTYNGNPGASTTGAHRFSYGFTTLRSGQPIKASYIFFQPWNAAVKDTIMSFSTSGPIWYHQDGTKRMEFAVTTATNSNYSYETIADNGAFNTQMMTYAGKVYDENYHHIRKTIVGSNTVQTVQTNSIVPTYAHFLWTMIRTLNIKTNSLDTDGEGFGWGHWTSNGSIAESNWTYTAQTSIGVYNNRARVNSGYIARFIEISSQQVTGYSANSVSVSSNQLQFVTTGSTGNHDGAYFAALIYGTPTSAPAHLMDASSASILLADDSDYDDNLLLVPIGGANVGFCYTAVLSNGGYEEGNLNGWTNPFGSTNVTTINAGTALVNAVEGNYFARASPTNNSAVWYQDYTIPASANVASGNVNAHWSFYQTDYATDSDQGLAYLHVINSAGEISAGWHSSVYFDANETWQVRSEGVLVPVPPGSAKIRVGYSAEKASGTELSWYVDAGTLDIWCSTLFLVDVSPLNKDFATLDTRSWNTTSGTVSIRSWNFTPNPSWRLIGGIPNYTYGSGQTNMAMYQVVTIPTTSDIFSGWIDQGSAFYQYRYVQASDSELDAAMVGIRFLNASSTVVGSYSIVQSAAVGARHGTMYVGSVAIPANTRHIAFDFHAFRNDGTNLDGLVTGINGQVVVGSPLGATSSAPGSAGLTGGALFRSQPITDNRLFPTPLTNVRKFPSD